MIDYTQDHDQLQNILQNMTAHLSSWITTVQSQGIVFGIDGFLDELWSIVRERSSMTSFKLMESMKEWADRISTTAGSSTNCETILKDRRTGGFVSNTSQGIATLAYPVQHMTLIGNFGEPAILPIFDTQFAQNLKCQLISVGNPGHTNAYEFNDGKVMMSNVQPVHANNVQSLLEKIDKNRLINLLKHTSLFGLGYWSITPKMNEIFQFIRDEICPKLTHPLELFLDLADLRKRPENDIKDAITLINSFPKTLNVSVSLNDKEAYELYKATKNITELQPQSIKTSYETIEDFIEIIQAIRTAIPIKRIIIHHPKFALLSIYESKSDQETIIIMPNGFTTSPKYTVAAGDTFNAGFCFGILANASNEESILLGNCLTSYFIRTGARCNKNELFRFLQKYLQYIKADHPEIL